jgi:hypothetical protein
MTTLSPAPPAPTTTPTSAPTAPRTPAPAATPAPTFTAPPAPGTAPTSERTARIAAPPRDGSGHRVVFTVPFRSAMSGADAELLGRRLGMTTALTPKLRCTPAGVARVSRDSGIFLVRGEAPADWALELRTWGSDPAAALRRWLLRCRDVAATLERRAADEEAAR